MNKAHEKLLVEFLRKNVNPDADPSVWNPLSCPVLALDLLSEQSNYRIHASREYGRFMHVCILASGNSGHAVSLPEAICVAVARDFGWLEYQIEIMKNGEWEKGVQQ